MQTGEGTRMDARVGVGCGRTSGAAEWTGTLQRPTGPSPWRVSGTTGPRSSREV